MRNESGVALVQVLVMSMVLLLFATGVLQIIFGSHILFSRTKASEENRSWVEACMAQKNEEWKGTPCNPAAKSATSCDFSGDKGPTVSIACKDASNAADGKLAVYTVTW
ncbi:MAG: hypothetical protein ABIJ96_15390 [Elusimicrobiota bacterium]